VNTIGETMSKNVRMNAQAPDFSLPDFSGKTVKLSDFQDKKYVILILNRGFT
jgi:peroxiredoxin